MFRSIYLKTLYNLRRQVLGWSLASGFVAFLTMILFNSLSQTGIEGIVGSVPDSVRPLIGSLEDWTTIPGYIGQQIFGPNLYIITIAAAIILALSVSVNEEDDKRLQTLLTLPVTRSAVFCQKWLVVMTSVVAVVLAIVAGIYLGLLVVGHSADLVRVLQSALTMTLLNAAFATVAFAIGMFTGKKGLTIAAASGYAVLSFIISSLAPSADSLSTADKFSLLHYYNNPLVMQHGLRLEHLLILASVIVVLGSLSWLQFRRRNIGV